jgi:hypothetical protein
MKAVIFMAFSPGLPTQRKPVRRTAIPGLTGHRDEGAMKKAGAKPAFYW